MRRNCIVVIKTAITLLLASCGVSLIVWGRGFINLPMYQTRQTEAVLPTSTVIPDKPFKPDIAHQLLILSYQRCGSTFFGDLFSRHPKVIYLYEPLDGLYTHLYGTREGWNVPSDIYSYQNGSERRPTSTEISGISRLLDDFYNCRIYDMPTPVLYNKFWQMFIKQHTSLESYVSCAKNKTEGLVKKCRIDRLRGGCPDRFNLNYSTQQECSRLLARAHNSNLTGNHDIHDYVSCLADVRDTAQPCERDLVESCKIRMFRAVKTVRASMASVEMLIQNNPNLRVIHLIRDPRAVVLSRKRFNKSVYGLHATRAKTMDMAREARLYCRRVINDVRWRRILEDKYPGIFRQVIYEEFVSDLITNTRAIYDFIGVSHTDGIEEWLKKSSLGLKGSKNATLVASKWQTNLTYRESSDIVEACRTFFSGMNRHYQP